MNKILTKSLQSKEILNCLRSITTHGNEIKKSVFISQSQDVYTNLALEDWLYKNNDFTNHQILMLWQNKPCVVIGRHQNPWDEVNMKKMADISLARRNSGGGTVYHDNGNLNLTFFTSKKHYDRKYNLELITRAIFKEFGVQLTITPKFDIVCRDYKVSGTASKLGRNSAYHHCTLLVNVNKSNLKQVLQKRQTFINSNATKSIPSQILNLQEENPNVNVEQLTSAVGWEYLGSNDQQGFQLLNPTDEWFPGLDELRTSLADWDWCYGKTPKFNVSRTFVIPTELLREQMSNSIHHLTVTMHVTNGYIENVSLTFPQGLLSAGPHEDVKVISNLEGQKYTEDAIKELDFSLKGVNVLTDNKNRFATDFLRQVMLSV